MKKSNSTVLKNNKINASNNPIQKIVTNLKTQFSQKLIGFDPQKQFQRKPSHKILQKAIIQKDQQQKRICFISPQKAQLFKKVSPKAINFNTLTIKQNNSFFSQKSSQMSKVSSFKSKGQRKIINLDQDFNSSFFSQISEMQKSNQIISDKVETELALTNLTFQISSKKNNIQENTSEHSHLESIMCIEQNQKLKETNKGHLYLIKKLKHNNSINQKQIQNNLMEIKHLKQQIDQKGKQINSLNQKLEQKQKIIKRIKVQADQTYLLKARLKATQIDLLAGKQKIHILELQNQRQSSLIKSQIQQLQVDKYKLKMISQTNCTLPSIINLIEGKRNHQIYSLKDISFKTMSKLSIPNYQSIIQQNNQQMQINRNLSTNIQNLFSQIKYKDIEITILKKNKYQTQMYKQMSQKLKYKNQNLIKKLKLFLNNQKRTGKHLRDSTEIDFQLSPQKF